MLSGNQILVTYLVVINMSPKNPSKYALRMLKLSGRIFAEYNRPAMPNEISRAVMVDPRQRQAWQLYHYQNEQVVERLAQEPSDFQRTRTPHYYPPHPQLKDLMATLREHGLYR